MSVVPQRTASPGENGGDEEEGSSWEPAHGKTAGFQHYFSPRPAVPHATRTLRFLYRGRVLTFTTDRGIFSYEGVDPGTALLIENMELEEHESVLDLGCGWGAIGIAAAVSVPQGHVVLSDVNHRAVLLARENAKANHLTNVEVVQGELFAPIGPRRFDAILTNPPFKAGREMIVKFLEEAPGHLEPRGRVLLVGKGSQGVLFYQRWLEEHWGPVEVLGRSGGYRVLRARPRG